MPIENKIRSVGNKSIIYPFFRRHIVIGPYNRHVRRDMAARVLQRAVGAAVVGAGSAKSRASTRLSEARNRQTQRGKPAS
jgi:hypothetical protein